MRHDRFLRGDCDAFARAFQDLFGGDLRGLFDGDGQLHHVFVRDPGTGLAADIRGLMPENEIGAGSRAGSGAETRAVTWDEVAAVMGVPDETATAMAAGILREIEPDIRDRLDMAGGVLVVVHPGSVWSSWAAEVDEETLRETTESILRNIAEAEEVVVIDGLLSEMTDIRFERALAEAARSGTVVHRLWGCDSGEGPFEGWSGQGPAGTVFGCQRDAAVAIAPFLGGGTVTVTGAWASRTGDEGCVNSVRDALRDVMPGARVVISAEAAYEVVEETPEDGIEPT